MGIKKCYFNWTLAIFKHKAKNVVFANEVKQSRPIFNWNSELDCFANARKDGLLINFIKMAKVQLNFSLKQEVILASKQTIRANLDCN